MANSQSTTAALDHSESISAPELDLSCLPPIYVLAVHLSIDEQHEVEDALSDARAILTYDIKEANIILGNISKVKRAKFELRWRGVRLEDIDGNDARLTFVSSPDRGEGSPEKKRMRLDMGHGRSPVGIVTVNNDDDTTTASNSLDETVRATNSVMQSSLPQASKEHVPILEGEKENSPRVCWAYLVGKVKVVGLDWLKNSLKSGLIQPLEPYTVYDGVLLPDEATAVDIPPTTTQSSANSKNSSTGQGETRGPPEQADSKSKSSLIAHGQDDGVGNVASGEVRGRFFSSTTLAARPSSKRSFTRPTHLLHQTTSEHDEMVGATLPSLPDWVREKKIYSCERATPLDWPNNPFICFLKKIKLARILTLDEIGVRAYSTIIASLAAYPNPIKNSLEILALPGCDQKVAHLFHEYQNTGRLQIVEDLEADPAFKILRQFYDIWGVGAKTAREFYYDKGWRDLDDVIEHGWKDLSRVQQIGLKYYDEFQLKIPRAEVESIAAIIAAHARLVTDEDVKAVIVGGYRRGKAENSDVDIIISHPHERMTHKLVDKVVKALEKVGWITHTLTLNLTNTKRNQEPLPIQTGTLKGHGFDTLDKALVVWQDPDWPTKTADLDANPKFKNPNPHRRVDIIISPWRTVGCAVAGWTSGTTFQRDLRRYSKYVKGWKFDSSGVRERGTGKWVDLERWTDERTRCRDWRVAERRVFKALGLTYQEPWNRCTG